MKFAPSFLPSLKVVEWKREKTVKARLRAFSEVNEKIAEKKNISSKRRNQFLNN
jgi:hypothetical protein